MKSPAFWGIVFRRNRAGLRLETFDIHLHTLCVMLCLFGHILAIYDTHGVRALTTSDRRVFSRDTR